MPFLFIRNDITKIQADAIVNPTNCSLMQGSGTSRAIYLAAGEQLLARACARIGSCPLGKAVITKGFHLPARYIIHASGPVWQDGRHGEEQILYNTYIESLKLARKRRLKSIAFPLLSSGSYGYPKDRALPVAVSAINSFLAEHEMTVYLILYDFDSFTVSQKYLTSVKEYIDAHYIAAHHKAYCSPSIQNTRKSNSDRFLKRQAAAAHASLPPPPASMPAKERTRLLDNIMDHMGETFSQMLMRLIDERGMTDPEVYHRANIDRKLFSKIRTKPSYTPAKKTVLAFAVALGLSLDETKDLLKTAGYSLSESVKFDVILCFFLEQKIYDILEINEMLFYYDQPLLGG